MSDSLDPFAFFKNESAHDDMEVRANAMKHVVHIVSLMDAATVRSEMLPYLLSTCTLCEYQLVKPCLSLRTATEPSTRIDSSCFRCPHDRPEGFALRSQLPQPKAVANPKPLLIHCLFASCLLLIHILVLSPCSRRFPFLSPSHRLAFAPLTQRATSSTFRRTARLQDHDQILMTLADKLGDFIAHIGGGEHAGALIQLLEPLCSSEESHVRDAAGSSVCGILRSISVGGTSSSDFQPPLEVIMSFWALVRRLAALEAEVFYPRYTAAICVPALYFALGKCGGMTVPVVDGAGPLTVVAEPQEGDDADKPAETPATYENVDAIKVDVKAMFVTLQADEISIVRSACCANFMQMAEALGLDVTSGTVCDMLRVSLKDDCPPIRVMAVEQLAQYAALLKEAGATAFLVESLLPIIRESVADDSWRIRMAVAVKFAAFSDSFSPADVSGEFFPLAMALLQDLEPDVRQAIIPQFLPFVNAVGAEAFLKAFMPVAEALCEDPIAQVRKLLASLAVGVAVQVGGASGGDVVSELVAKLVVDEDPMIRIRILKQLSTIAEAAPALCTRLADALKEMFTDSNWRIRQEMVSAMPAVIRHLGVDFFESMFVAEYLGMLRDSVDEVRNAVADTLVTVVPLVGMEWAYEKIFQAVRPMSNADFLLRLSMLSALQGLLRSELPPGESFQSECLALVVAATNDRVPNVRMKAAQVLSDACNIVGPDISRNHIRPVLNDLQGDADRDVAFFATEGMKLCT